MILDDVEIPAINALKNVNRTRKGWNFPSCGSEDYKKGVTQQKGYFFCEAKAGGFRCHRTCRQQGNQSELRFGEALGMYWLKKNRTRKGWNFPSCGSEDYKKGVTQQKGYFFCEAFNRRVDYPMLRYRLELDVSDDTTQTVVVMFDKPATALVGCFARSLLDIEDESADDHVSLTPAILNLIGTTHVMEIKSHTYYEYRTFKSFTCWQINPTEGGEDSAGSSTLDTVTDVQAPKLKKLVRASSVATPSKPSKPKKIKASGDSSKGVRKNKADLPSDNKKGTGIVTHLGCSPTVVIEDSNEDVSCGSPKDGNTDRADSHSNKKK
nr:hypothetical protein [Tanacetum cinerariifolium]